jgi:hypothetical protein
MKIFGIGLAKTGTTSLFQAMEILGYRSIHDLGPPDDYLKNVYQGTVDFKIISEYDFIGNPLACFYYKLARVYPDAKFILTVRDEKKWYRSMQSQFNKVRHDLRTLGAGSVARLLHTDCIRCDNQEDLLYVYRRHNKNVIDFFADKPSRLLVTDVTESYWSALCLFLKKPIPSQPFPHLNKSKLRLI